VRRAFGEAGCEVLEPLLDRPAHDIADLAIIDTIAAMRPDLVVHCAAMTDVDGCARDPDAALRVNALGTRNVALGARRAGAALVAISTNEVFSGTARSPYDEWSPVEPINPYGRSKAIGEAFVRQLVPESYIVRTAWLFGPGGNNFVTKMIARAKAGPITIVADEVGSPTYAPDLADALVALVHTGAYGTYHLVNEGVASRLEFAQAIFALAGIEADVTPTTLAQWPRASQVPPRTPLRNLAGAVLGIRLRPWREALAAYLSIEAA
jgi:dTDP-4-dehydrorhamnose reductase